MIRRGRSAAAASARALLLVCAVGLAAADAGAGEADVVSARARCDEASICRFIVTVRHADVGWSHYANAFEVVGPDGEVIATRVLRHPHVHEQPFTRTLDDVEVPAHVEVVTIRARDLVHGLGGDEVEVKLQRGGTASEVAPAPGK